MEPSDKRIADLEAQIRAMLAAGVGTAAPAASDGDWIAIDLAALRAKDPTTAGLFGRHRYDIAEGRKVSTIYDADYGEALTRARCFPYIALTEKRREIAALLRDGGMPMPPPWWNLVLTPANHNRGVQDEIMRLEAEIGKLAKLMIE